MTQPENDPRSEGQDPLRVALSPLGETARQRVLDALRAPTFAGWLPVSVATELRATVGDAVALEEALLVAARDRARPAVSGYRVGAVLETASGDLALGSNLEFAGAPLSAGVHAEQSAAGIALLHGAHHFRRLTVTAPPCGHCRQFLLEFPQANELAVRIENETPQSLEALLPTPFGPTHLGQRKDPTTLAEPRPMDPDAVARWALARRHAPYTGAGAGVCLVAKDQLFPGATVESAAFHPTLPALQMALVAMTMRGATFDSIDRVVIAEPAGNGSNETDAARLLVASLAPDAALSVTAEGAP